MLCKIYTSMLALCLLLLLPLLAQEKLKDNTAIETAIENKNYAVADSLIQKNVRDFVAAGQYDTLLYYIPLKGKLVYKQAGAKKAIAAVYSFIDLIKKNDSTHLLITTAFQDAAEFFGSIGQNQEGYNATTTALSYAVKIPGNNNRKLADCEYNLGVYAQRLANVSLSAIHHRKALQVREAAKAPPEEIYQSNNSMAACMWYASKYDSATFFYKKAFEVVNKMPDSSTLKFFRLGIIENNIAGLYSTEGKSTDAITAQQRAISYYQQFIAKKEPHPKKHDAYIGLFQAIDNLAGLYKEIGDYGKAGDLLNYSYQQKIQKLNPDEPDIFFSEILLGLHYNSINNNDKARQFLTAGLLKLEKSGGNYLYWQADANYGLAMLYANLDDKLQASQFYNKSDSLFEASYQGDYDNIRMDFSRNASLFYAQNGESDKALAIARKVLSYLQTVNQGNSLQAFYQLNNLAEIELIAGRYSQTINYSNAALTLISEKIKDGRTVLDSVKMEVFKPKALLLNAKATYHLREKKDSAFLTKLANQLTDALQIVEKRKVLIDDPESINILIADNNELIDFSKKIEIELYQITGNEAFLNKFINLHESGIYNRIRSRLDKEKAIKFTDLPLAIQQQEQQLKMAIPAALKSDKNKPILITDYLAAVNRWQAHLDSVKKEYPAYFEMRYGSIFKTLPQFQSTIPKASTLVRYFFTGDKLFALVVDQNNKKLIELKNEETEKDIKLLLQSSTSEQVQLELLHSLHKSLWAPLAAYIKNKNVLIIPDGVLYSLSFDMLTPTQLKSFRELAQNSLLNKHIISYHYSLFMLQHKEAPKKEMNNYIAFAPGFADDEKNDYVQAINDSVKLDYQYLSLLPQPNTSKLTSKIKTLLGGKAYLNNASTTESFKQHAAGHKIIHIGTHAEYNNLSPEKSRLIFAKNSDAPDANNSLYLPEIYNSNIRSNLTILTACESGKPGYQDGEGMVSLAHAFNYAGSKSILTGLWNLDEQSSNLITEYFIENLTNKIPTDEALQKAKLKYLQHAEGRMLAPVYWAGLILMGESDIIDIQKTTNYLPFVLVGGLLILVVIGFLLKKKNTFSRQN